MSSEARSARALTRRLILRCAEGLTGAEASAAAAQAACERACSELSLSLGPPGFYAVLRRALVQSEAEYPFLNRIRVNRHAPQVFAGVPALVDEVGSHQVAAALESVLDRMFTALGRLIGEDLVARLIDSDDTVEANAEAI